MFSIHPASEQQEGLNVKIYDCSSDEALEYHSNFESGAAGPQHVVQWDPAVLQDDVCGGRGLDAQLVLLFSQRESGVRHGDQEGTDSLQIQTEWEEG